jgi:uncharacterized membrane protein YccF (DUF307 family)
MGLVGNIIYILTGGALLSLGWCCAGLLYLLLPATRPLGRSCFQLAGLCIWPADKEEKFDYKLAWMRRLAAHAAELYASGLPLVLAGDYNVVPTYEDIYKAQGARLGNRTNAGCAALARET